MNNLYLCSTNEQKSYVLGPTRGWVHDNILGWTKPLKKGIQNSWSSVPSIYNTVDNLKWLMGEYAKIHSLERGGGGGGGGGGGEK